MIYDGGQVVQCGDLVALGDARGVVVAVISSNLYSDSYIAAEWSYLKTGLLINFDKIGLTHYPDTLASDVVFISRAP